MLCNSHPSCRLNAVSIHSDVFFLFHEILHRYLIACHTTNYGSPWLFLNTVAVFILVIAKFPNMHKVRIFGINSDYPT